MANIEFIILRWYNFKKLVLIGGAPSPSATWTFSRRQLQALYNKAYKARKAGKNSKDAYSYALIIAEFAGYPGFLMSTYLSFQSSQFDAVQTSLNTLGRALASGRPSVKIEIKTWVRPINGQKLSVFTRLP